ncbi:MAG: hypothetical protein IH861_16640 [Chloroflexi bacterium]|nr:hypothetical protein [Chloroflexota bacterium]
MKFKLKKLNGKCVDAVEDIAGEELINKERCHSSFFRKHASRDEASSKELLEVEYSVMSSGYALFWSDVVEDFIAFYGDEKYLAHIPPGFVPYSVQELWHLFGKEEDFLSNEAFRLIHKAKKTGAIITGANDDQT